MVTDKSKSIRVIRSNDLDNIRKETPVEYFGPRSIVHDNV